MLIKHADDQAPYLAELEQKAKESGPQAKQADKELRLRRAGIRSEAQAAYLIDFDFGSSDNWAVIHDLRLEHGGRVAQIDHVLINRFLDIFVLETKSFSGIKITEDGEFLRWNSYKNNFEGMASPLEQNSRHIQVLKDVVSTLPLPERLGIRLSPAFHSYVLVESTARIDRPKRFDSSRVIKSDQLRHTIDKKIDNESAFSTLVKAAKLVAAETIESIAIRLAALHAPARSAAKPASKPPPVSMLPACIEPGLSKPYPTNSSAATPSRVQESPPSSADTPTCKHCKGATGSILHGKYGYYLRCGACQKNTALRPTCLAGHAPRVRKELDTFYRECTDCGTSMVIFRNSQEGTTK